MQYHPGWTSKTSKCNALVVHEKLHRMSKRSNSDGRFGFSKWIVHAKSINLINDIHSCKECKEAHSWRVPEILHIYIGLSLSKTHLALGWWDQCSSQWRIIWKNNWPTSPFMTFRGYPWWKFWPWSTSWGQQDRTISFTGLLCFCLMTRVSKDWINNWGSYKPWRSEKETLERNCHTDPQIWCWSF